MIRSFLAETELETNLFNINDLSLLLVISECLLLALLLLTLNRGKKLSHYLLAFFLLSISIEAFDTLIYWSQSIKEAFFADSLHLFFVLKFAAFLQGPLLYWYTKSVMYSDFRLRRKNWLHLIPIIIFPLYLIVTYHSLGRENMEAGVYNYDILYRNSYFRFLVLMQESFIVIYSLAALLLFREYHRGLKNNFSNIETIDRNWLRLLVGGFLFISTWRLFPPLFHLVDMGQAAHLFGLTGNYLDYLLVTALVFYSVAHSEVIHSVVSPQKPNRNERSENFDDDQVEQIVNAMTQHKHYLEPELTLEQLAEQLGLSPRLVSNIINRKFNKNFFEFVNYYRVEQAKEIISSMPDGVSMIDVMADSGFNSKSAFNRFFKKYTGMTPTEFRKTAITSQTRK